MGLLDAFLKAYHEREQPGVKEGTPSNLFVDKVDKGVSTMTTNAQPIAITDKFNLEDLDKGSAEPQDPNSSASKKLSESTGMRGGNQNVDIVACVRGNESANLTSLSHKKDPSTPPPVGSFARASNIVYKIAGCDSCPACGRWEGYGRMGPGRYCFYSAYFKGKAAKPVPIAEAQKACQKEDEQDLCGN
jgi:hypothetical protein